MAYLVIHTPTQRVRIPIQGASTVGRGENCDIWIDDPRLSRQHFRIEARSTSRWVLVDLGSANGTFVEVDRVTKETVLSDDQTIYAGGSRMVFYEGNMPADRASSPLEIQMRAGSPAKQQSMEDATMVGEVFSLVRPIPRAVVPTPKRTPPAIPLPFTRPRAQPIPHAEIYFFSKP